MKNTDLNLSIKNITPINSQDQKAISGGDILGTAIAFWDWLKGSNTK